MRREGAFFEEGRRAGQGALAPPCSSGTSTQGGLRFTQGDYAATTTAFGSR